MRINPEFEKLPLKGTFVASIITSAVTILLSFIAQIILPPQIPLYYGLPQTVGQLAPSYLIILPSLLAIVMTIINIILSINSHSSHIKKTLAFASILISVLATITTFKIIFLVGAI